MTIDDVLDPSRPSHYEMVCRIREALGVWCPATFIGYNSLRFDEEFLRQAFYQSLHPPYLTNTGGSGRADALHIIKAAAALTPGAISIPVGATGRPVFKLDRLAPANGFAHLNAHDALADVEATIHLCRMVKEADPRLWKRAIALSRKADAQAFIEREDAFVLVEPFGGSATVVAPLGQSAHESNAIYCFDLRGDVGELASERDDQLLKRLKRAPRPIRRVKTNAAPILIPLAEAGPLLGAEMPDAYRARAAALRAHPELVRRLMALSEPTEAGFEPSPHVEQQIYDGFWSDPDRRLLEVFHRVDWTERVIVAERLADVRLRRLARRIIFFERPDLLPGDIHAAMADEIARRRSGLSDEDSPWLTAVGAARELEVLLERLPLSERSGFDSYRGFLTECLQAGA